jgi:hypothetical protein
MLYEPSYYTLAYSTAATSTCPALPAGAKGELVAESDTHLVLRFPGVTRAKSISASWTVEGRRHLGLPTS